MDRKDFWFGQLVSEAFIDEAYEYAENGLKNFAVDIGVFGIVSGAEVSQHDPTPDMTVDVSGPSAIYDQSGARIKIPTDQDGLNCAEDENGTPSAVGTPGNERWLSVIARFTRILADPVVDRNGITVYSDQKEGFELAVIMAAEATIGTDLKPAKPSDAVLLTDLVLVNGQTQIVNANFDTTRRDTLQVFPASTIPVDSALWTFLSPVQDQAQHTFDFIDERILEADASRRLTQDLLPSTATEQLGGSAAADRWAGVHAVNAYVYGSLMPGTVSAISIGSSFSPWLAAFLDSLYMGGTIDTDGSNRVLGTSASGHWYAIHTNGITGYAASIDPSADNTGRLGLDHATPKAWASAAIHSARVTNLGYRIGTSKTFTKILRACRGCGHTAWDQATDGSADNIGGGAHAWNLPVEVAHGAELSQVDVLWYQSGGTEDMQAALVRVNSSGVTGVVSGPITVGGLGTSLRTDSFTGLTEKIDHETYDYFVRVIGGVNTYKFAQIEVSGSFDDGEPIDEAAVIGD